MAPASFTYLVVSTYGLLCLVSHSMAGSETLRAIVNFYPGIALTVTRQFTCHDRLNATIDIPGTEKITLNLQQANHIDYNKIPILSPDKNSFKEWTQKRIYQAVKPCFYNDLDKHAAISLTSTRVGTYRIRGVFHTDVYSYTFSPDRDVLDDKNVHYIERKKNHESYIKDEPIWRRRRKRQSQTKTSNKVELLVVIDNPLYNRWYSLSKEVTPEDKERDTVDNIKYYFTHIIHEIDLRYRSIDADDYELSIVLSGIFIAKSSSDLRWEEDIKESATINGKTKVAIKGSDALESFGLWLGQRTSFMGYDHGMLFTGYDLYEIDPGTGRKSYNKIGTAFLNGVCSLSLRVSIVEDKGHFKSALTAAHELGHNLGASHDGDGNNCRSADQYIMASTVESRVDENVFRFSSCSIRAFRALLNTLRRDLYYLQSYRRNCLLNKGTAFNRTASEIYLKQTPGSKYSPNDQCALVYGRGSFFCGGQSDVEMLCQNLVCHNSEDSQCYALGATPAFPGTTCGNKKLCRNGQCVHDPDAPERPENCTFGDTQDVIRLDTTNFRCADLIERFPSLCYDENLRDLCCESCGKIYRDNPTCAYGDKQLGCSGLGLRSCKLNHDVCCESCARYMTGIPGCEFGDQMSWCGTIQRNQCYLPEGRICCQTCHRYKTNITDCEFGDKISVCQSHRCSEPYYAENCCQTCAPPTTTSMSTTTTSSTTITTTQISTNPVTYTTVPKDPMVANSNTAETTVRVRAESSTDNHQNKPGGRVTNAGAFIHKADGRVNVLSSSTAAVVLSTILLVHSAMVF